MRRPVRTVLVAAATAVGLCLTGCAQSPSNAAVIDGRVITEASVTTAADALTNVAASLGIQQLTASQARSYVIAWLLRGALADKVSQASGVTITDAAITQAAQQDQDPTTATLLADPGLHDAMVGQMRLTMLAQKVPQEVISRTIKDTTVTLSPRYGQWVPESQMTVGTGFGLSAPLLSAAGS